MLRKAKGHPEVEEMVAFLGKGTDFNGVLHFDGTIRVDGRLDGEVHTKDTLIVGESAEVTGTINVGTIISSGRVSGTIVASKKAHMVSPGAFTGDISTPTLQVDEGFTFNGRCDMKKDAKVVGHIEPRKDALTA